MQLESVETETISRIIIWEIDLDLHLTRVVLLKRLEFCKLTNERHLHWNWKRYCCNGQLNWNCIFKRELLALLHLSFHKGFPFFQTVDLTISFIRFTFLVWLVLTCMTQFYSFDSFWLFLVNLTRFDSILHVWTRLTCLNHFDLFLFVWRVLSHVTRFDLCTWLVLTRFDSFWLVLTRSSCSSQMIFILALCRLKISILLTQKSTIHNFVHFSEHWTFGHNLRFSNSV